MSQLPLHIELLHMSKGYLLSQCVYVAAKLGIADHLKKSPLSCIELASATQSDPQSLQRLMNALTSLGIFTATESQQYTLTPLAECLCSDVPHSVRNIVIMWGEPEFYQTWGGLLHTIKTGKPAFEERFGMNLFEYYQQNPTAAEIFERSMNNSAELEVAAMIDAYDFSGFQTLVDVGGGYGKMIAILLQRYPHSHGILFDEAHVIDRCLPILKEHGIIERCKVIGGSFFDFVPPSGDAYLLKYIIHDWDDERAIAILKNCRQAMPAHGKILIIEKVILENSPSPLARMFDINMLVMCPGGKERTEEEFKAILEQAGLEIARIVPTIEEICIIEATIASNSH
ncbi:acetylserotonin O-methyltransferase [Aetokthonos hydrillicola Thurmond2011]|uniref:Acetylserotonin O-methyltransferase n=1 Tax=Aetokthonos hydrillicola Thurmond2011 TaxID=2712845 RepID=A0AAP5I2P0_9CYAN|nr:methyltransferase [Aetokthonos hydrillicola]MBW4589490.1 methyltransferase [Aetokthonos hydrillicola CCALA 1050]MDR9893666.1 acetylserotonin O-methyltransferase [Aetokthonos hydrillicola Thurmond2011]